jgi:hypothetical protein
MLWQERQQRCAPYMMLEKSDIPEVQTIPCGREERKPRYSAPVKAANYERRASSRTKGQGRYIPIERENTATSDKR